MECSIYKYVEEREEEDETDQKSRNKTAFDNLIDQDPYHTATSQHLSVYFFHVCIILYS